MLFDYTPLVKHERQWVSHDSSKSIQKESNLMGTAQVQGELWSAQARNWANLIERFHAPLYKSVFDRVGVNRGTRLLDVGCGAGLAAQLATELGAQVTGIDAAPALIEIARERVPDGDFRVGDMEELPYAEASFDVVTGFNSFPHAAKPVVALKEAKRVARVGGQVAMVTWGKPQDCEHASIMAAIAVFLPVPPTGAGGVFALSEPGRLEALLEQAGLTAGESGEIASTFAWPDDETAWKAISSAANTVMAVRYVGEQKVRQAVLDSLAPFITSNGGYREENKFRYVIATA
jgi:2-polyprenyl-3-methyl-5-hydroxy-6-metoxy-1,4-benzoquinol methylase